MMMTELKTSSVTVIVNTNEYKIKILLELAPASTTMWNKWMELSKQLVSVCHVSCSASKNRKSGSSEGAESDVKCQRGK